MLLHLRNKSLTMSLVCFNCNEEAYGMVITALGHKWHPECFTCSHCGDDVTGKVFHRGVDGKPVCDADFKKRNAPLCAGCKKPITGDVLGALNSKWHTGCFVCTECRRPLRQKQIYTREGKPYCQEDFEKQFLGGKKIPQQCYGCKGTISGQWVDAIGQIWHPQCFVCKDCNQTLQGESCFKEEGHPYCAKCAMKATSEACEGAE